MKANPTDNVTFTALAATYSQIHMAEYTTFFKLIQQCSNMSSNCYFDKQGKVPFPYHMFSLSLSFSFLWSSPPLSGVITRLYYIYFSVVTNDSKPVSPCWHDIACRTHYTNIHSLTVR